jgi:hypothetical protein
MADVCTHLDMIRIVRVARGIVTSLEPGEDWSWCYVDQVAFVVEPG